MINVMARKSHTTRELITNELPRRRNGVEARKKLINLPTSPNHQTHVGLPVTGPLIHVRVSNAFHLVPSRHLHPCFLYTKATEVGISLWYEEITKIIVKAASASMAGIILRVSSPVMNKSWRWNDKEM